MCQFTGQFSTTLVQTMRYRYLLQYLLEITLNITKTIDLNMLRFIVIKRLGSILFHLDSSNCGDLVVQATATICPLNVVVISVG